MGYLQEPDQVKTNNLQTNFKKMNISFPGMKLLAFRKQRQ